MVQQRHNRSSDAGRIAICESWAEHLEQVYTDREFGGNTSLFPAGRTWETNWKRFEMIRPITYQ